MASWEDVRRIALELPEAGERRSRGNAQWTVKDKLFVWERPLRRSDLAALGDAAPEGPILGARVEHEGAKQALIADDAAVFFTIPHFDGYPAILVVLDRIDVDALREVVVEAWLARAPPKLAQAYLAAQRGALVRAAGADDAAAIGRLLHAFNTEFDEPTPAPRTLARRVRDLMATGETVVLLADDGPDGLALLRFRPSIWTRGLEAYLAELYVVPERRRQGLGLALMEAALDLARERGSDYMFINTSDDDAGARALYERLGFSNREGGPDGPLSYFYERAL